MKQREWRKDGNDVKVKKIGKFCTINMRGNETVPSMLFQANSRRICNYFYSVWNEKDVIFIAWDKENESEFPTRIAYDLQISFKLGLQKKYDITFLMSDQLKNEGELLSCL